jgi:hypothetical protein
MRRSSLAQVAVALLVVVGTSLSTYSQTQDQPPLPARSRSDEMLDRWNDIGKKLVAMAQDFPGQVRLQTAERRAHLRPESAPHRRSRFRPDTLDLRIKPRPRLRRG